MIKDNTPAQASCAWPNLLLRSRKRTHSRWRRRAPSASPPRAPGPYRRPPGRTPQQRSQGPAHVVERVEEDGRPDVPAAEVDRAPSRLLLRLPNRSDTQKNGHPARYGRSICYYVSYTNTCSLFPLNTRISRVATGPFDFDRNTRSKVAAYAKCPREAPMPPCVARS